MDYAKESLKKHLEWRGRIETKVRAALDSSEALSLAYTSGVAAPCLAIRDNPEKSYELTRRRNTAAVVTDGSAVLGLGDIGPEASMPVMEGKRALFKAFGGVDAVPICIDSRDVDEIVSTVRLIAKSFGGINLEDISAPRRFRSARVRRGGCSGKRSRPARLSSVITGGPIFQPTDRYNIFFVYFDICNSYCLFLLS
ncbi:MAG: NADP-dependent malic enzyme [Oscillospiraceae bacterium]|nr:NADP-dependent malic enzyme [Oscillospiraceae bacterium]